MLGMDIKDYLPPSDLLKKYSHPGPYETWLRENLFKTKRPGCDFALVTAAGRGGKGLWIVPAWHTLALTPEASPGYHYAQGWFEGGSVRPVYKLGQIPSVNIVLEKPRNDRFIRSAKVVGIEELPVNRGEWEQGIRDLVSLFAPEAFMHEGKPVRVYLRPAGYREGDFGVTARGVAEASLSCIGWKWPLYLPQEVYTEGGVAAAFVDQQRLEVVRGKVFGNYTFSGEFGKRARQIGAHEAVLFGPYILNDNGDKEYVSHWEGQVTYNKLAARGVLADGPGEDVVFFESDAAGAIKKLLIQPRDTGILAGTTRSYLVDHLAPAQGIEVAEQIVSIDDVRQKRVQGMAMCGNAANLAPMRELDVYTPGLKLIEKFEFGLTTGIRDLVRRFDAEFSGRAAASNENLLTNIPLNLEARSEFEKAFKSWF